jgi:hypothetical protein
MLLIIILLPYYQLAYYRNLWEIPTHCKAAGTKSKAAENAATHIHIDII